MSIKSRLFTLCDPLAEAMSDKDRIDAFVKAGLDAVAEIERLTKIEAAAKALLDSFRHPGDELRRRTGIRALDEATKS
jgi:hypothetical protein